MFHATGACITSLSAKAAGWAPAASGGFSFTSSVCAPANVAVIPSTAKPATPTITLHTDLFMLPPLPLLTGSPTPRRDLALILDLFWRCDVLGLAVTK